jgi:PhnB protein
MAKATGPIPTGFHTITLHLAVNGAAAYSDFLQRAFGAAEIDMPALAEGRLPFHIHIYLPDVDSVWEKAVAAGCQVEMPLGDQFWGDRYGQLKDPFGILWALATRKEELTQAERQERFQKAMSGQA